MLTAETITFEINNRKLVKDVTFNLCPGEMIAVLGANGAGKSTMLKMLSGELKPTSGSVSLNGKALSSYRPEVLARKRAVMNQQNSVNMDFLCSQIVLMGRYPHYKNKPAAADLRIVTETLEVCGVGHLAERAYFTLSGGEQQRVQLARVLAQVWDQPGALILMDEPVASMDLQYQQQTLAILKALSRKNFMVIAILHEINLAAQYADRIIMLKNGRKWQDGSPVEVLKPNHIYTVFNVETEVHIHPATLNTNVIIGEVSLDAVNFNSFVTGGLQTING